MKRILIIGASGAIGTALAETYRSQGWQCAGLSRTEQGLDLTQERSIAPALATLKGPFEYDCHGHRSTNAGRGWA